MIINIPSVSGKNFQKDILIPALKEDDHVIINLDGLLTHTSSFRSGFESAFLKDAFSGLTSIFPIEELREKLKLISVRYSVINEAWSYIEKCREAGV